MLSLFLLSFFIRGCRNSKKKDSLKDLLFDTIRSVSEEEFNVAVPQIKDSLGKLDLRDGEGITALTWAIFMKIPAMVETLLHHRANANFLNKGGSSPLAIACCERSSLLCGQHLEIIKILLESGADVEGLSALGVPCLLCAVRNDDLAVIKILTPYVEDINRKYGPEEITALHVAFRENNKKIAIALMRQGARYTIKDSSGVSPWDLNEALEEKKALEVKRNNSQLCAIQ